jgi:hypothetical protein
VGSSVISRASTRKNDRLDGVRPPSVDMVEVFKRMVGLILFRRTV